MAFIVYSMRNCVEKIIREFFRHGWRARAGWRIQNAGAGGGASPPVRFSPQGVPCRMWIRCNCLFAPMVHQLDADGYARFLAAAPMKPRVLMKSPLGHAVRDAVNALEH